MDLYCAVDLREGRAVRLVQGDFAKERRFGDPLELTDRYLAAGATHLHVVDLDAARTGRAAQRDIVKAIIERSSSPVQVGGGVRSEEDVAELLGFGADRVVMGTTALRDPEVARGCARRYPGRLAVGLDYRRSPDGVLEAAASGWAEGSGSTVGEVLASWRDEPLGAIVLTAIDRDGTGTGPDIDGLEEVLDGCEQPVIASGGVGSIGDLHALASLRSPLRGRGPSGVVVGMALLDGSIEVTEAVAVCTASA